MHIDRFHRVPTCQMDAVEVLGEFDEVPVAFLITDPTEIALALPVHSERATANVGDALITAPQVLDETDVNLLATTQIVFSNPPTTYQINGAGPLLPYTSGNDIDVNGWRVQISGAPEAGDTFTVQSNAGGPGDNGNGLLLSAEQFRPMMVGGTATFQETYGLLVGEVGATTQRAQVSSTALAAVAENALASRDALSGVNLDEEAANLLRYQQAFQAAAQVIRVADEVFQSLINAARG